MFKYKNLVEAIQSISKVEDRGIFFINDSSNDTFVSYSQLYRKALGVLKNLLSEGLTSGDELVFQVQENEHYIYLFWACLLGGIVPAPVSIGNNDEHRFKLFKILDILERPNLLIDSKSISTLSQFCLDNNIEEKFDKIFQKTIYIDDIIKSGGSESESEEIAVAVPDANKTAFIQFSSGSTGDPKGVVLTHENLIANTTACINGGEITKSDSFFSWLPLTHDMGIIGFHLTPIVVQANQYIMQTRLFVKSPILWIKKAQQYKASILGSPNFGYSYFLSKFSSEIAEGWDLSNIRLIFNGAEPISQKLCKEFLNTLSEYGLKKTSMFPVYGMAEACLAVAFPKVGEVFETVWVDRSCLGIGNCVRELDQNDSNALSFVEEGYAVDFCNLRICDDNDQILGDRVVGQIHIKGINVTRGYYNNPEVNEKLITQDRWLKTGDLGFMRDGCLVVTGRLKDIIFVNGQNYYSHDIENVLEGLEEINTGRSIAVGVFNNKTQTEEIVIYVLFKKKLEEFLPLADKIKKHIREKMGLIVEKVIPIKKVPKTTSGKVQRYKLAEVCEDEFSNENTSLQELKKSIDSKKTSESIKNEMELSVTKICHDILSINNIGVHENLYELGLNSLKIASLAAELHEKFNIEIPINDMFMLSTIKDLTQYIEHSSSKSIYSSIEAMTYDSCCPTQCYESSSAQKRLYVLNQIDLENIGPNIGYNMPEVLQIDGELDKVMLKHAFDILIQRHEALRTTFDTHDGELIQKIHKSIPFNIEFFENAKENLNEIIKDFIKPFQLDKPPLIRVGLAKIEENMHILIIDMHHIISDGWSLIVLLKELVMLLEGLELPELRLQFKEFAVWQNKLFKSDYMQKKEEYWLNRFKDYDNDTVSALEIPTDYQRPLKKTYEGDRLVKIVATELMDGLNKLARDTSATLHMVMLAAYNILLSKYCGKDDIIVGSPIAARPHKDLQNIIGMFVNMLSNRNSPKNDMSFGKFLNQVKENCLDAYQNQEYQFDELVGKLKIKRDTSRNPIFDYVFAVQNFDVPNMEYSKIKVTPYDFEYKISRFDMFLSVIEIGDTTRFMLEYSTAIFKKTTAERILNHYIEILKQIIENVDVKLGDIILSHSLSEATSDILEIGDDFLF